ncbi:MAG: Hsp20/alpha crystallin family protein [Burkholderiaceae bacterium]|jgi:HSP20 family protein
MYLSLYRPSALRPARQAAINDAFDRLFGDFVSANGNDGATRYARFDLIEKADHYEAQVELPGIAKEDIEVEIDGATVSVTASSKTENKVNEGERVLHTERRSTSYARRFELPSEVADATATASFENGVLKLVLPKKEESKAKRVQIQ